VQTILTAQSRNYLTYLQHSPDIARFRVVTANPREKGAGRKGNMERERQQGKEWERKKGKNKGKEICFGASAPKPKMLATSLLVTQSPASKH